MKIALLSFSAQFRAVKKYLVGLGHPALPHQQWCSGRFMGQNFVCLVCSIRGSSMSPLPRICTRKLSWFFRRRDPIRVVRPRLLGGQSCKAPARRTLVAKMFVLTCHGRAPRLQMQPADAFPAVDRLARREMHQQVANPRAARTRQVAAEVPRTGRAASAGSLPRKIGAMHGCPEDAPGALDHDDNRRSGRP